MNNWSFSQWAIAVVIALATFALVMVAAKALGIAIPGWVITVLWICAVAFIVVAAIKLLARLFSDRSV